MNGVNSYAAYDNYYSSTITNKSNDTKAASGRKTNSSQNSVSQPKLSDKAQDLLEKLKRSKLPIMTIHELKAIGESKAAKVMNPEFTDKVVAVVEYRDGTIIDVVRKPVQEF